MSTGEIARITVDTTVATKAVAHPTDSHLLLRAVEWLNRAADKVGITLRQSYVRVARHARREVARLLHTGGHVQGMRHLRKMRTWVGRLYSDIARKTEGKSAAGDPHLAMVMERVGRLMTQKPDDKNKLYALHAPEVECIGKRGEQRRF